MILNEDIQATVRSKVLKTLCLFASPPEDSEFWRSGICSSSALCGTASSNLLSRCA